MHLTITNDRIDLPPGGEVVLRHQTWLDYEKLSWSNEKSDRSRTARIS